jgi:hypothetical protein
MKKPPPPWFWDSAVLLRLAILLLGAVFLAYAIRMAANIYWPFG